MRLNQLSRFDLFKVYKQYAHGNLRGAPVNKIWLLESLQGSRTLVVYPEGGPRTGMSGQTVVKKVDTGREIP